MNKRNILLIEPNYPNKYPPIGLMKLATYHRKLGDNVVFFKGDLNKFVIEDISLQLIERITSIDNKVEWHKYKDLIQEYIHKGKKEVRLKLVSYTNYSIVIDNWFEQYRNFYRKEEYIRNPKWDRICISTLFTFHWKISIETIEFAKKLVKDVKEIKVGGVLATVLADEVEKLTGIKPYKGLLDKPGILDDNSIIIDTLPLDYSILEEIDYKYPEKDAYYGYMTRGCIRKCSFCAVPKLEPNFQNYVPLKDFIKHTTEMFGEKRNLLLLDNNVLASNCLPEIIEEIKECGFTHEARYIEPNQLDISIKNLNLGINDRAFIRKAFSHLQSLLERLKGDKQQELYNKYESLGLLHIKTTTKENILQIYPEIKKLYEKFRNKVPKKRYVDFNQGVDARLIVKDEWKIKLLSEIPIYPLRIAFDSMKYEKVYVKAVGMAAKYNIRNLSNYLLYNEKDKPIELYQRLKINIDLCEKLNLNIYSFPMKFHPINGKEWFSNRDFIGPYWNRKFIRAIQTILNATKGKIGRGKSFFDEAFGKDEAEYFKLLYMPEPYILYRVFFKENGYTDKWWNEFNQFSESEILHVKEIIESNDFNMKNINMHSHKIKDFILNHYTLNRDDILKIDSKIILKSKKMEKDYFDVEVGNVIPDNMIYNI